MQGIFWAALRGKIGCLLSNQTWRFPWTPEANSRGCVPQPRAAGGALPGVHYPQSPVELSFSCDLQIYQLFLHFGCWRHAGLRAVLVKSSPPVTFLQWSEWTRVRGSHSASPRLHCTQHPQRLGLSGPPAARFPDAQQEKLAGSQTHRQPGVAGRRSSTDSGLSLCLLSPNRGAFFAIYV